MKRREFVMNAWQAASLVALGSMLEGCGGNPASPTENIPALPAINGTQTGNTITVTVDAASPIATVGNAGLLQTSSAKVLVARTAQDTFSAVTAICTHEQCTIQNFQSSTYTCSCHGSQYNTAGQVLKGPAARALQQFPSTFSGTTLTITV